MPERPLRVALCGLGFMGTTHLRAWYNVTGAKVTAVITSSAGKLSGKLPSAAGNLPRPATAFDLKEMQHLPTLAPALGDPEIDAVDLCLPTHLHYTSSLAALRAGKHVFVEKPLARTSRQAYELVAESHRAQRTLMAGHVLRFFPEYQALARHLAASPVKLASFLRNCGRPSWSPWLSDPACSGGAPLDLLIHDADFALHCFGTPTRIAAVGLNDPASGIDWLSAHCTFPKSVTATMAGGWHADPCYPFSMEFTALTAEYTLHWHSAGPPLPLAPAPDPFTAQLQHFTDSARAGIAPALAPPESAAQAVRFVELLTESRHRQGEPLPWTD